jgi:hypothetical protein
MGASTIHTHISKMAREEGKGKGFFHFSFVPNMFLLCSLQWVPVKFPIVPLISYALPKALRVSPI